MGLFGSIFKSTVGKVVGGASKAAGGILGGGGSKKAKARSMDVQLAQMLGRKKPLSGDEVRTLMSVLGGVLGRQNATQSSVPNDVVAQQSQSFMRGFLANPQTTGLAGLASYVSGIKRDDGSYVAQSFDGAATTARVAGQDMAQTLIQSKMMRTHGHSGQLTFDENRLSMRLGQIQNDPRFSPELKSALAPVQTHLATNPGDTHGTFDAMMQGVNQLAQSNQAKGMNSKEALHSSLGQMQEALGVSHFDPGAFTGQVYQ